MAARAKIGDIIEIQTTKGLAYAQVTHIHKEPPRYGHLLRVLEGFYQSRPVDLHWLASQPVQFQIFFPASSAVNQKIVAIAGTVTVPAPWNDFPVFRVMGLIDPVTKKAKRWGLWTGETKVRLERALTEEEKKLPILEVVNDTMLIELITDGWRPEYDMHT